MKIRSVRVQASPLNAPNAQDIPEGAAFRLVPLKGQAAFPRRVLLATGQDVDITDPGWMPMPNGGKISIPMPYYSGAGKTYNACDFCAPGDAPSTTFDQVIPATTTVAPGAAFGLLPELWRVDVADQIPATPSGDAVALASSQLLWQAASTAANNLVAGQLGALIDTAPWKGVLFELFLAAGTATTFTIYGWQSDGSTDGASGASFAGLNATAARLAQMLRTAGTGNAPVGTGDQRNLYPRYVSFWGFGTTAVISTRCWGLR